MSDTVSIGAVLSAISALGAASPALVDAAKLGARGGISNAGFGYIEQAVQRLFAAAGADPALAETGRKLLETLHGMWINGAPLEQQKAIAKSLIKLRLDAATAAGFGAATGVAPALLAQVAANMSGGAGFSEAEINALGRFDIELTALLDHGYHRADQRYRNLTKVLAGAAAVALAVAGGWSIEGASMAYFGSVAMWRAVLCGLLATPLAPLIKDCTSAVAAGASLAQTLKR